MLATKIDNFFSCHNIYLYSLRMFMGNAVGEKEFQFNKNELFGFYIPRNNKTIMKRE